MDKIIKVNFEEWQDIVYVDEGLVAWNYGEILQVEGLALPDGNIEVHFSFTDREGDANVYIGTVKDNVLTVGIPDFIFQKEDVYQPTYDAYAFIYQTDGDSGRTIKKITFTIKARPEPTTDVPEDKKDPFLDEVRQIMADAKEVAQSVREDADNGKFNGPQGDPGKDGKSAYQYAVEGGFKGTEQEFIDLMAQAGQVDLTGYVSKEQHEAELLKAFVKVTTEPSPYHHITDSANMKVVDFGMSGKTEQDTTSGKNYYSGGDVETTDGAKVVSVETIPAGTYTISANVTSTDTDSDYCLILLQPNAQGVYLKRGTRVSATFTTNFDITGMAIYASNNNGNSSGDTATFTDIQIEPGEVATEYEPYTNGSSPNPDYEQPITLAGVLNEETGRYEHKCCVGNKNEFDESKLSNGEFVEFNGVRCYKYRDDNKNFTYQGDFLENTQYTINAQIFRDSGITYNSNIEIFYTDGTYDVIQCTTSVTRTYTTREGKTVECIKGAYNYNQIVYLDLSVMQIEIGSSATKLLPHASQPFTLTSDRPLTKWDKLVQRDGVWGWSIYQLHLTVGNNVLMGIYLSYKGFKMQALPENMLRKDGYCNQMLVHLGADGKSTCGLLLGVNDNWIYNIYNPYYDDTLSDYGMANFKEHLVENPLEIWTYSDTEQAFIPLPEEEQTLLHNLETYYGVTNVYNEQGCPMWLTYISDPKLYVDQKLLQIQQAII